MSKQEILKQQLVRVVRNIENSDWTATKIVIQFPPYTNKGFKTLPLFLEANGNKIRLFPNYDDEFTIVLLDFIKDINSTDSFNELAFSMSRDKEALATLDVYFSREVDDNFQSNLPKSKRGKTIPWWKLQE